MNDEQKFECFKKQAVAENEKRYGKEIREKYGDAQVEQANAAMMGMSREQHSTWTELGETLQQKLEDAVRSGCTSESEEGRQIAELHRQWLTLTGTPYTPAKHRGIAELYVLDERFTAYYDKQLPGCARFLRDAVACWIK